MKLPAFAMMAAIGLFTNSCQQQPPGQSSAASALKPVAMITSNGGTVRRVGELIKVDSKNSVGDARKFTIDTTGVNIPGDVDDSVMLQNAEALREQGATVILPTKDEQLFEVNGDSVYFASYEGVIRVVLSVASATEEGIQIDTAGYVVTVRAEGSPPKPPDTPKPPDPDPVPPEGFGLGTLVPGWLATVPANSRGEAAIIKQVLVANADLAAGGKYRTIAEMQIAIGAGLTAGIKDKLGWAGFGMALMTSLDKLKLKTPEEFGRAISEVAGAL